MNQIYDNCCGIDVHKKLIVACFKQGSKQEMRELDATTRELLELCDWLKEGNCQMVAMESTASFWKPLYNVLEASDLNTFVVNARHMKNVPGKKKPMSRMRNGSRIFCGMVFWKQVISRTRISVSFVSLFVTERALPENAPES